MKKTRQRLLSVWVKLFLVFALVLFIGFFVTVAITYIGMWNKMSSYVRIGDNHIASFLACRMQQIFSHTPIKEAISGFEVGEFPFPPPFKRHIMEHRKTHGETKDSCFRDSPQMIKRLEFLQANYAIGQEVELFKTLVSDYWFLFLRRNRLNRQQNSTPTFLAYMSPNGKVLYATRSYSSLELNRCSKSEVVIDGKLVGYVLVNSLKGIFLNKTDSVFIQTLLVAVILALCFCFLLMGLLSFLLIRKWFAPLTLMRNEIGKIANGQQIFLPERKQNDEFTLLARALNSMSGRLQELENQRKQMLVDISHELRTPVALLNTRLEMISSGHYQMDEKQISFMSDNLTKLSNLIDQIHQLSILESIDAPSRMEDFDLVVLLKEEIESFDGVAKKKGVALRLQNDLPSCMLHGSIKSAKMSISNILSNAFRYVKEEDKIEVSLKGEGGHIMLAIADSGIGVDEDKLPLLFDRFYRADSSRSRSSGGSGIGLALVKAWVNSLNGTVKAFNNELGGLTIYITI